MVPGDEKTPVGLVTPETPNPSAEPDPDMVEARWTVSDVKQLMGNFTIIDNNIQQLSLEVNELKKTMYEAAQGVEQQQVAKVDWGLDAIPEWFRPTLLDFLGNIGKAAKNFASGGVGDGEYDDFARLLAQRMKEDEKARTLARVDAVVNAVNSNMELYAKPRPVPAVDPTKEASKVG